jgi:endoglucanase
MDKESKEIPKLHQMFVDIGAKDKEDALKFVAVGDPAVFDISFKQLPNNRAVGRGFDDRVGAWCVAETLRKLARSQTITSLVYGVATVQEENGMFGAEIGAYNVKPEVAIAIDVTHATDSPGISKERCGEVKLGAGPSIGIGSVANPKLNALLIELAEKKQIPLQREARPRRSGTDADAIFRMLGGIPTANVSIPNRYMHTPVEMVCLDDLDNAVSLLTELCEVVDGHDFVV